MDREKLLAAETFSYNASAQRPVGDSYANYADHLGIGHVRFEELMPQDVRILERAEGEGWPIQKLARALEVDEEMAERFRVSYSRAKDIIDAPHAGESFRRGVRYSIQDALKEGLQSEADIERLVTQICYRAADLAYLLDLERKSLTDYSQYLRETTEFDRLPPLEGLLPPTPQRSKHTYPVTFSGVVRQLQPGPGRSPPRRWCGAG